jgi:AraC-like DNA-binding protein
MHGKALELFALIASHLAPSKDQGPAQLTKLDRQRIAQVRGILLEEMGRQLTLAQLARRIGVNRSKLAVGFKSTFGTSVQAYWRELRLCRARELLANEQMPVTEVAAAVGYADISCLTRSFQKRFGILPKDCKRSRGAG